MVNPDGEQIAVDSLKGYDSWRFIFAVTNGDDLIPLSVWKAIQTTMEGRENGFGGMITGEGIQQLILYSDERFPIANAVQREYYLMFRRRLRWGAAVDIANGAIANWVIPRENHCLLWRIGHYFLPFVFC